MKKGIVIKHDPCCNQLPVGTKVLIVPKRLRQERWNFLFPSRQLSAQFVVIEEDDGTETQYAINKDCVEVQKK
jgi:hypothetical protein